MVMLDPPDHTAFRRLVGRGFTPRQVTELEPQVRAFVVEPARAARRATSGRRRPRAAQAAAEHGRRALPRRPDDGPAPGSTRWTDAIVAATSAGDALAASAEAVAEMFGYFSRADRAPARRPGRRHDLPAGAGRRRRRASLQMLGFAFTMVTGGNDTTTGLLGGAPRAARPSTRTSAGPGSTTRVGSPTRSRSCSGSRARSRAWPAPRPATVELHGRRIPAGARVLLLYAAANRDPREFGADAEELDVDPGATADPHLQPRRPPLPRRGGRAPGRPGRARGAARRRTRTSPSTPQPGPSPRATTSGATRPCRSWVSPRRRSCRCRPRKPGSGSRRRSSPWCCCPARRRRSRPCRRRSARPGRP